MECVLRDYNFNEFTEADVKFMWPKFRGCSVAVPTQVVWRGLNRLAGMRSWIHVSPGEESNLA